MYLQSLRAILDEDTSSSVTVLPNNLVIHLTFLLFLVLVVVLISVTL